MNDDQVWLDELLAGCGAVAGSIHRVEGDAMRLVASKNLPPPVLAAVAVVPRGKGMGGLAFSTGQPVQTCNLQEDQSGRIKPLARSVSAQAAVALPVLDAEGSARAVVGIAFGHEGEIPTEDVARLLAMVSHLPAERD